MNSSQTADFPDLISDLFSSKSVDYDLCQRCLDSYVLESAESCVLRHLIATLLSKQFPSLTPQNFDLASLQRKPFNLALLACLNGEVVSYDDLTFFEKLVICNATFVFDCVCEKTVIEVCQVLMKSYSQNRHLMILFHLDEMEARHSTFSLLAYTLLDLAHRSQLLSPEIAAVREAFFDVALSKERELESDIDVFAESIYQITRDINVEKRVQPVIEMQQKVLSHSQDGIDLCFSFDGKNSGIGSIAFEQVRILTFGPQVLDLGQIDRYGIGFSAPDESNVHQTITETKFSCRGWSRFFAQKDMWVEHDLRIENEELELIVSFESFGEKPEIAECFFVSCDAILVDEKLVKVGSLDQFRGVARSVVLISGREKIKIYLHSDVITGIIPLAGGAHFWGATFLIAFEPEDLLKKLHLTISKDFTE